MEKQHGVSLVDVGAEIIALRQVVRLLVANTWGHNPAKLRQFREVATASVENALGQVDMGENQQAFTANVLERLEALLADMPPGFGKSD